MIKKFLITFLFIIYTVTVGWTGTFVVDQSNNDVLMESNQSDATTTSLKLNSFVNVENTGAYDHRGFQINLQVNPDGDQTANNTSFHRAFDVTAIIVENAGTIAQLNAQQLNVGSYNASGDVTATITNAYGLKINGFKEASTTIDNIYGLYIGSISGTNAWDVYAASNVNNYFSANIGLETTTFGTNATSELAIGNGTDPTAAIANGIQIFSTDSTDNTASLGLYLEQVVEAVGTFTPANKIKIEINGTWYWIQLDPV